MADREWFARGFGNATSDVRRALIEEAWFGRPDPRQMGGPDTVLRDKLDPARAAERSFLNWLEREAKKEPLGERDYAATQEPSLNPGHDFDR